MGLLGVDIRAVVNQIGRNVGVPCRDTVMSSDERNTYAGMIGQRVLHTRAISATARPISWLTCSFLTNSAKTSAVRTEALRGVPKVMHSD